MRVNPRREAFQYGMLLFTSSGAFVGYLAMAFMRYHNSCVPEEHQIRFDLRQAASPDQFEPRAIWQEFKDLAAIRAKYHQEKVDKVMQAKRAGGGMSSGGVEKR